MKAVIGTRASRLALAQTQLVVHALRHLYPQLLCRIQTIQTEGDRWEQTSLTAMGGKGIFLKEIEQALLAGEVDLAVHSLKDMPTEQPEGLTIGAVCERGDPRDVLIAREGLSLEMLPRGARVGTGSPRRSAQLRVVRPDLRVLDLRGNVETRLRKLDEERYDAIVLAAAGLVRLGLASHITEYLSSSLMLPAVGQGALALEIREDDSEMRQLVRPLEHNPTRIAVEAERTFLRALGGGCRAPITAYASVRGDQLVLQGMVACSDGSRLLRDQLVGDAARPEEIAQGLAERLLQRGADEILQTTRHESSL
jgi:hydroxymethylbilane synthase